MTNPEHISTIIQRLMEEIMSQEHKLCEPCRENLKGHPEHLVFLSCLHCHHEEPKSTKPSEKPAEKCWCEMKVKTEFVYARVGNIQKEWDIIYCPVCAKKL